MKIKIFNREVFSIEADEVENKVLQNSSSESSVKNKAVDQTEYFIGEVQYEQLRRVLELINELGGIEMPKEWDGLKRSERLRNYHECKKLLSNIISSYEHFKEKREGPENEKK